MSIQNTLQKQNEFFHQGHSRSIQYRKDALLRLKKEIINKEEAILTALKNDLGKSYFESYITEVSLVIAEIDLMLKNINRWSKKQTVSTTVMHFPARSYTQAQPYGQVLIIAPWNYPFQLSMMSLIGSIAAGNCSIVKPSEVSIHAEIIIKEIIESVFDPLHVTCITGDKDITQSLLDYPFDYIFFTGSTEVGKIITKRAAEHLTPVTLELGGKSPCIIDSTSNLQQTANRIIWGKLINAGQTCIAPDYLWVQKDLKKDLIKALNSAVLEMYGQDPISNLEYPKIINKAHYERLMALLSKSQVDYKSNSDTHKINPTLIEDADWNHPFMQEEIFGPILPILEYDHIDDVISTLQNKDKPLALYLFTDSKQIENKVLQSLQFGSACINDTLIQFSNPKMGFGGVGASGMGSYHGKASFDTFSHQQSIMKKSTKCDISIRYAPFKNKLKFIKKIIK